MQSELTIKEHQCTCISRANITFEYVYNKFHLAIGYTIKVAA